MGKRSRTTQPNSIGRSIPHDEGCVSTASSRGLSRHCTRRIHLGKGSPSGHVRSGSTGRMSHCMALRSRWDCMVFGMKCFLPSSLPCQCSVCTFVLSASIRISSSLGPSGQFITNTTISDSASHGIDRGWSDGGALDFLAGNTFSNIAQCLQTFPRDTTAACPSTPPCP